MIKRALYHNAAAVVLAHNHPSGEVTPSKADRLITERLVQALASVDIRVPDHLIVGGSRFLLCGTRSALTRHRHNHLHITSVSFSAVSYFHIQEDYSHENHHPW